jgi:hypothetical protein
MSQVNRVPLNDFRSAEASFSQFWLFIFLTQMHGTHVTHFHCLRFCNIVYTAISVKVVHEQSGKVDYHRERLLGIANKLMHFQSDSQQPFALVFDFSALHVDNLNWNSCIVLCGYICLRWVFDQHLWCRGHLHACLSSCRETRVQSLHGRTTTQGLKIVEEKVLP